MIAAYTSGSVDDRLHERHPGPQDGGPSGTGYTDNQRPNVTGESCKCVRQACRSRS